MIKVIERVRYPKRAKELVDELNIAKKQGDLEKKILEIFSMHEMDMLQIWECRHFFRELPDEFYKKNKSLIAFRALVEAMAGNVDESERLATTLYGRDFAEIRRTALLPSDYSILMMDLVLPGLNNYEFAKRVNYLVKNLPMPIPGLALTACRPSVINGFRDMTSVCYKMQERRERVEKDIFMLYGKSSKGIYEVALAEWKYETNSIFESLLLVADTIPTLDNENDIRCLVAAYALQMRILILNGQAKSCDDTFEKVFGKIRDKHFEEMERSLRALRCLFDCYEGRQEKIEEWLENYAPNENLEIFTMDIYSYFVKMRCYLQTGRYMMTSLLSKRFIEILGQSYRPHDLCECYLMSAMACYKAGDNKNAIRDLEKALKIGIPLGYRRVFSDEGQMMVNLIQLYRDNKKKEEQNLDKTYDKELRKIKAEALIIARRFPSYLEAVQDMYNELTKTERAVLELLAEGLSNDEIASELDKKSGSIKFHTSGIYRKLKVENRQQAINVARSLGIV